METANINKIFLNSGLTIDQGYINTLCFIDGIAQERSRYSMVDNEISIYREAGDYISLFYDYNNSHTYFYDVDLDNYGVIVAGADKLNYTLDKATQERVMIFIDGQLIKNTQFEVLDKGNIALLLNIPDKKSHSVIVFVTEEDLYYGTINDIQFGDNEINYNRFDTMIFKNGKFIAPSLITNKNGKITADITQTSGDRVEYYKINGGTTRSLNFAATLGYVNYGPVDDFKTAVPLIYDSFVTFDNLAKVCVDDLRPGFLIREKDNAGCLMVVDTVYETNKIKTIQIQNFSKTILSADQYFLEVPEAKSIVDYLSEYDKKFMLLPEVLKIFQRVILDEIHDEVERVKNIRSLRKVDSEHINKLIQLLGMDLNIKNLNIKQRQELLDEINEFYRTAGVKSSYNYFNVFQDNTRIVDIKQLFTYHKKTEKKEKTYTYDMIVATPGTGYKVGQKLNLLDEYDYPDEPNTGIIIKVLETNNDGGITSFSQDTYEGDKKILTHPCTLLSQTAGAQFNCYSTPTKWQYNLKITDGGENYNVGDKLYSDKFPGTITVTEVSSDSTKKITQATYSSVTGGVAYNAINAILSTKTQQSTKLKIKINSVDDLANKELVYDSTINNDIGEFNYVSSDTAKYYVEFSGGGGAGGAADSGVGSTNDVPAWDGYNGYTNSATFLVLGGTSIYGVIGAGGNPSRAQGAAGSSLYSGAGGIGYEEGNSGVTRAQNSKMYGTITGSDNWETRTGSGFGLCHSASGAGGGSTSVVDSSTGTTYVASGGDGGDADFWFDRKETRTTYVLGRFHEESIIKRTVERIKGGKGGSGGGVSGNGAAGGGRNANDNSFISKAGQNGWVKIYKIPQKYTFTLIDNENVPSFYENKQLKSSDGYFDINLGQVIDGVVQSCSISPTSGVYPIYTKTTKTVLGVVQVTYIYSKTYDITFNQGGAKASLTSTPIYWNYTLSNSGVGENNYVVNDHITIDTSDFGANSFEIDVNKVDGSGKILEFTYSPKEGDKEIGFERRDCTVEIGTGATILVQATADVEIQNTEREYIDFYLPEERGGEYKTEYRIPSINYGSVSEGSPYSPYPWEPGNPDIDYGSTGDGSPMSPDTKHPGGADIDYGLVSEKIKGEWVRWLDWDRPEGLYPTNHVEVQINIMSSENYDEVIDRFYSQFYNLASAVLYIHRLVTVFNFGNNTQTGLSGDGTEMGNGAIFVGIMTAPVYATDIHVMTSNPKDNLID